MVNITAMADRANGARQRRKLWSRFVRVVAMVVVFCTTYALILPAITMESKAICGQTEHTHTAECYETVEPAECTLVESEGHTHSEACYTYDRQLACALEEGEDHTHGDDCYNVVSTLVCTEPESEGHSHADDVTEPVLVLTCELEEHVHTAECYPETEPTEESTDETTLPAGNPKADLETAEDWEKSLNAVKLTGKWHEDVLAVAQSQLGYQESTANYQLTEDGAVKGITRYGQWYGDPYGDWCAMFVSFCVRYAEIPEEAFPIQANCVKWIETLDDEDAEKDMFRTPEEYTAVPGDLIFFDFEHDGTSDHIGLVVELIDATEDTPAQIKVIEGNSNNRVQYVTYDLDSEDIVGYGVLPTEPAKTYSYSDNDVQVDVVLPADSTVPADAVLKVTPIEEKDDGYDDLVQQAEDTVCGAVNKIKLYDISFYTEDQEYIPVDDRAQVSMRFVEAVVDTAADVAVLHYDENDAAPTVLEEVSVEEQAVDAETVVTFETDGFSIFAVVELTSMYQTVDEIAGLENKSFIIAGVNNGNGENTDGTPNILPVMTSVEVIDNNNPRLQKRQTNSFVYSDNKVTSLALTDYTNAVWKFEKAGTGTYYIKNSQGQYLSIPAKEQLKLSGDKQEFRVVPATGANGASDAKNAVCIQAVNNSLYVDLAANDVNNNFTSWDETTGNPGHHLVLVEYVEPQTTNLTDLDGKSYIIAAVNFDGERYNFNADGTRKALPVMTSVEVIDNNNPRLQKRLADSFVYSGNGNVTSVVLSDYTGAVWTFETAGDGTYYIKNSQGQYLSIPAKDQLALSGDKQKFRVVTISATDANVDGDAKNAVCIQAVDNSFYVDLAANDAVSANRNFTSWNEDTSNRGHHLVLIEYEEHQVKMPVISDAAVNNLGGKKIVITNVNGVAITGTAFDADNDGSYDHLEEKQVTIENGQSAVTISSESSADLVWEFVATGTPGQYNIKHVATGKYMNIYQYAYDGNKPLTVEQTNNPQAIQVLSANADNNPNAVWFRFPQLLYTNDDDQGNNNDYNAIDHYDGGFAVWNKSSADTQNQFLLSEYTDLPMMDAVGPSDIFSAENLNGQTMVITAANGNAAMSNNTTTDSGNNNRGWLEAQEVKENNGVLSVATDAKLADVSWKFESVPGTDNQYYIKDSNNKYLNIGYHDDQKQNDWSYQSGQVTLSETPQAISVYEKDDGTFVLSGTETNTENDGVYLLDFSANSNGFSAWNRAVDDANNNNSFKLTPVEQFDQDSAVVTNLDGQTLALISIYDANKNDQGYTTPQLALTSTTYGNGLEGVKVDLSSNTGKVYTFDDDKFTTNNELWTFEAVDNKLGVYYIKASNSQYLNLDNGSATVSGTKQEITVLTNTFTGLDGITYEGVYLRAEVNGVEVYLRREYSGTDVKLFGDDDLDENGKKISERNFVLAQPFTINIDVEKGLTLETDDWLYKPHFGDDWDSTRKEVADVEGTLPTSGELGAEPVDHVKGTSTTQHFVSFCFNESMDPYTAGKGRDFPQAYMASWAPGLDKLDGSEDGYIDRSKIKKDDFIAELRDHVYDPDDFKGESPYWGVEYELTHYEVILPDGSTMKDANGNVVKFAPGTSYKFNDNGKVTIEDVNGQEYAVPSGSTFKAQYIKFSDILTFYINLYGVVADTAADIQPRYIEDFTLGLSIAHIYYPGQYAGDTTEDYNNSNEFINSLFKGAYGENVASGVMHAVIDGFITRSGPENRGTALNDPNKQRILSNRMTPALGASATELAAHVLDYIRTVPDIDIMLKNYVSGNGEDTPTLNPSTINTATFDVRWYVVKWQGDSWHIDGVTIGKTDPIPVTKTFYGLEESAVNAQVSYERSNETNISGEFADSETNNYQIGVYIAGSEDNDGNGKDYTLYYNMHPYDQNDLDKVFTYGDNKTCHDPNLNPATDNLYTYNGGSNPYSWTVSAILKQHYMLKEENYDFEYQDEAGKTLKYDRVSKVTVKDKNGTSTDTFGTSAYVTGGETGSVEFNNYYTKPDTGMFIVKKVSSVTGLPLAGAKFVLYNSGYTSENSYGRYVDEGITDVDGEVSFYNLESGLYTLREETAPDGFDLPKGDDGNVVVPEWKIKVDGNGKVYDFADSTFDHPLYINEPGAITFNPLKVTNEPAKNTLKVVKKFVGIAPDQVATLAENYKIEMKPEVDGNASYTLKLEDSKDYTLVVSPDGLTYTWTLTNVPEIGYTVTESNFKLKNYVTTVSVKGFEDGNYTTYVTSPVVVKNTATFNATFNEEHEDGFTITNSYASDFFMQITKVDSTDPTKKLSGVTFDVYGDHFIATDTSTSITVGNTTLYKLGSVITDENGMATFSGWEDDKGVYHKLQLGYAYALEEINAPAGYNRINKPIYLGVIESDGVTGLDPKQTNVVFSNGILSITVENMPGYELPESGGMGTLMYTMGGMFIMAAPVVYGFGKRRRRERRAD